MAALLTYRNPITDARHRTTRNYMGPPCYGRSDCVDPFTETIENVTDATTTNAAPKRYIVLSEFKSPIFGAYKYDPLLGDFVLPNLATTTTTPATDIVMRADDSEFKQAEQKTTTKATTVSKPTTEDAKYKNHTKEKKGSRRNLNDLTQW
ncbi:uncharacterized protein LOC125241858 isoform X2 [Leguminivora glycinivorella]|uniref:uncharacterized protein LOC125241858 isoform X2 n=1 Tax=Leguminivora glycinivorella TaxID=1035111 RepID=UPI00200F94B0|nr:uncharacterized protein LOC125241858 isoform X2 [Leguminivora glycinivorella]